MCSQTTLIARLAFLLPLFLVILSQGDVSPCLYNQRFDFFSTTTPKNTGIYTITQAWTSPQTFVNYSIILIGFNFPSTHLLSYDVWMANVTNTGADVVLSISQTAQIISIRFQIILGCPCDAGSLYLRNIEFFPTILSTSSRASNIQKYLVKMSFQFQSNLNYYTSQMFLTSFSLISSGNSLLFLYRYSSIGLGQDYEEVIFETIAQNEFSKIRFTYIMIDVSSSNILAYQTQLASFAASSAFTSFNIPSIFASDVSEKCIIGLREINYNTGSSNVLLFFADIGTSSTVNFSLSLSNTNNQYYSFLCIQECSLSTKINYQSSTTTCVSSVIDHCLIQVSSTICSKCIKNYFLSKDSTHCSKTCSLSAQYLNESTNTCESCVSNCLICVNGSSCDNCSSNYNAVKGGCTNVVGCNGIDSSNKCNSCQTELSLYLVNGSCVCQPGYKLVTQLCTNVDGCNAAKLENSRITCISCNIIKNFIISNGSCICNRGYQMNSSKACEQICGDGMLFTLPCDDGNNENGDGCSSSCNVQDYFECSGGSSSSRSQCKYLKQDVSLSVVRIDRAGNNNVAVFTIKLLPALTIYDMINLTQVSLQCNQSVSQANITLQGDQLTVRIAFYEDIEGKQASISVSLDPTYFFQSNVSLKFKIVSDGVNLYVLADASRMDIIDKGIKYLALVIMGCFFISFFAHKMIGVEMLTSLQVIFYLYFALQRRKATLSDSLSNSMYQHIVFPFTIGTFLVSMMLMKRQKSSTETSWLVAFLCFSQTIFTSLIFFYEQKALFLGRSANKGIMGLQKCDRLYVSIYVSFLLSIAFVLILGYQFGQIFHAELVLFSLYFAFLVFTIVFRPYQSSVHNFGLAVDLLTALYFIVWSALKRMGRISESEQDQIIFIFAFLLLVILSLAITLLRFIHQLKIKQRRIQIVASIKNDQKNNPKNENILQQQQTFMKRIQRNRIQRYKDIQPQLFISMPINPSFTEDRIPIKSLQAQLRKKIVGVSKRQLREQLF